MLTPGLRVADHYTLERSLGEGAMGEVWAARHVQLDHRVAIKFATDTPSDEDARETFLREARLAAAVRHRHVVRVIDVGTDSEVPYLVMEFLEGDTLADRMDFGALPPRLAAQIAIQILGALEACHREGVIHRDLKPENVFLSPEDSFVTLVDFGIAKAAASSGRQSAVPTREGAVFGTPEYMAPEQARGDDLDHRADVFAAGVLFYEMLAGRRPFEGNTSFQVLLGVLQGEFTPLETLRPDLPELAAVIHKAMAPDPASRFGSAAEMRDAIRTVVRESSAPPPPPAPVTRPRSWMAATFVGAMLIFGAVAMGAKAGGVETATDGLPVPARVEAEAEAGPHPQPTAQQDGMARRRALPMPLPLPERVEAEAGVPPSRAQPTARQDGLPMPVPMPVPRAEAEADPKQQEQPPSVHSGTGMGTGMGTGRAFTRQSSSASSRPLFRDLDF